MGQVSAVGRNLAKSVFQAHGADASGRARLLVFFAGLPPCVVTMEASAGAHHWGRELTREGPYGPADPAGLCEAVREASEERHGRRRGDLRGSATAQHEVRAAQAGGAVSQQRGRQGPARESAHPDHQRPARALAEYGCIVPKGVPHVGRLIAPVEDPAEALPPAARTILLVLVSTLRTLDQQIAVLDAEIASRARHDPVARRLMTFPGTGPITATALVALAPPHEAFKSGRHLPPGWG